MLDCLRDEREKDWSKGVVELFGLSNWKHGIVILKRGKTLGRVDGRAGNQKSGFAHIKFIKHQDVEQAVGDICLKSVGGNEVGDM